MNFRKLVMSSVTAHVLTTVNAPYGAGVSAHQLAAMVVTVPKSGSQLNPSAFSFFSEVPLAAQKKFLKDMGVDEVKASKVASQFSKFSGYALPLAA
jgi:hypothetical protein